MLPVSVSEMLAPDKVDDALPPKTSIIGPGPYVEQMVEKVTPVSVGAAMVLALESLVTITTMKSGELVVVRDTVMAMGWPFPLAEPVALPQATPPQSN